MTARHNFEIADNPAAALALAVIRAAVDDVTGRYFTTKKDRRSANEFFYGEADTRNMELTLDWWCDLAGIEPQMVLSRLDEVRDTKHEQRDTGTNERAAGDAA